MAGRRRVFGDGISAGSNTNTALLHNRKLSSFSSEPLDSLFISGPSSSFLGSGSMVSFEDVNGGNRSGRLFFHSFNQDENGDEDLEEYFRQPDKKRRLTGEQVHFLERNFEMENKLEPERKVQLAKDLGLQPRQVAIWFQNRRARWKTKQLEKEYEALQSSYDTLKADYDTLLEEKEKLKVEVLHLRDKVLLKEKGSENSDMSDTDKLSEAPAQEPTADSVSEGEVSKVITVPCKQEDLMAKSDMFDSESHSYIDMVHSSLLEPGDSSYVFEPEQSDLSQDEDDSLSKSLLPPPSYGFSKIEDTNSPAYPCYYRFQDEDHTFGFWSC